MLDAVRAAAARGVRFPLSAIHYAETGRILDWRQRKNLTDVVAPISLMQTIRAQPVLMRHQFLVALHETLGRPAFRPPRPEVLGVGVHWAFSGVQALFKVVNDEGQVIDVDTTRLRHLNQYAEAAVFAGPLPDELPGLVDLGYVAPRVLESRPGSRVEYEQWLSEQLADRSPDTDELRALVMAREIHHEYTDLLNDLFADYRLTLSMITGGSTGMASRAKAVAFMERVPTARISADMKALLFRNKGRSWSWNMLRDIDALSLAIPYCHVVVTDKDAADLLGRTGAGTRHGTKVVAKLHSLPELLDDITSSVDHISSKTAWDELGPGDSEYHLQTPEPLPYDDRLLGASMRLVDASGRAFSMPNSGVRTANS
ncbi:hypothetical protein [Micrococcus terreus]|uniref:Uncharacterized protein n=1 Tax=Micrococcus terreus TaxID=574650 RepID=A0A1I7MKZ5_9MICC|nr:hypothetical protein [Micrococcus terreus]SFV22614.1 hypothetical protein SAMN04487966_104227 [Micrococcus terreus]